MSKIRPISVELQKTAIEELNEKPEQIASDIANLRTWIQQQPHLNARTDDQFLLTFLRGCKYSLEKSKSKIDKFYSMRSKFPEIFSSVDVDNENFRKMLRLGTALHLPTPLHEHGPRILILRSGVYPADMFTIEEFSRFMQTLNELVMIDDDYAVVNGVVVIMDMSKATMAHFLQMTPTIMKKMSVFSEEAIPIRQKASHFINTPSGFEPLFNIIKPLMTKKQQERLFVHGDKIDKLHEKIPKKYLPEEYGGENGNIESMIEQMIIKLEEYREFFKENSKFGVDEKLRPGKPIDYDNIFGVEGSFRKLDVD